MPRYATETTVPVERSRAEIEETLRRYKASGFLSGWKADAAMIGFKLKNLSMRFVLPFPPKTERRFTWKRVRGSERRLSEQQAAKVYEQELRSRWRALLLVIKAKLEAVECGISTIEQEFLSFIVGASGATVGEWILDQGRLQFFIETKDFSRMLPAPEPKQVEPE